MLAPLPPQVRTESAHEILPAAVRALVAEMRLEPASFSKCRRALASAGILTGAPE